MNMITYQGFRPRLPFRHHAQQQLSRLSERSPSDALVQADIACESGQFKFKIEVRSSQGVFKSSMAVIPEYGASRTWQVKAFDKLMHELFQQISDWKMKRQFR